MFAIDGLGKGAWVQTLFDPAHPNLYIVTLPSLVLFALGLRKVAVIWLFLSVGFILVR